MNPQNTTDVVIVEDNAAYLEELSLQLSECNDLRLMGQYTTGAAAIEGIRKNNPDVALIDIELPDISGVEVIETLSSDDCSTEFLVLTVYDDDAHLFPALQAGAMGYIVKGVTSLSEIQKAIHDVIDGGAPMSPVIAKRVLETFQHKPPQLRKTKFHNLTKREMQILEYISRGYSTKKAADDLHISYETVRTHLKNIYQKLHVHTLVEALVLYKDKSA